MKTALPFFLPTCLSFIFVACLYGDAKDTEEQLAFFENKIRPVLVEHCYTCHSSKTSNPKGGLLLDTRQAARMGGDSGEAVVPSKPDESLLLSALKYEDYEMPPKGQLPAAVIADFEQWIRMGAADPREGKPAITRDIDIDAGRQFWAFQPLKHVEAPAVENTSWPQDEVDRFVLARLEDAGLAPVTDADPAMWLRRVSFDLIGLPPTEAELADFLADESENAKEIVVDRLLNSRHFGERWGRHWLDVARYAESTGRTRNYPFPFAWRYRDYVIDSFNADKPFDQFIVEQIAGDQLSSDDLTQRESQLVATGFLAVGSPDLNERDEKVFKMDMVADQIDTMSRSMLALTIGCARCHDHKFDPIPTDDYYALAGIFKSTQLLNGYAARGGGGNKARGDLLIKLGEPNAAPVEPPSEGEQLIAGLDKKKAERLLKAKAERDKANAKVQEIKRNKELSKPLRNQQLEQAKRQFAQKNRQLNQLRNKFSRNRAVKIEGPACLGVRDAKQVADCNVHIRGDTKRMGVLVPRGFLQVASQPTSDEDASTQLISVEKSGRLELAQWIASSDNPLTPRVFVNRVWLQLFGRGIVRTVDNFGQMGARPSHPDLLDYLADQFVASGWSTKQLIRQLVLSRTYGMDFAYDAHNASIDQENTLLWRMNSRRLDFEAMRDSMLLVSDMLDRNPPTGSYVETLNIGELSRQKTKFDYDSFRHRSVYLPVLRNLLPDEMSYFDFPDGSETRGARDVTTVPTQSLYLLNSGFVLELAGATAKSLVELDSDDAQIIRHAHLRVFGREASDLEVETIGTYVEQRLAELSTVSQQASDRNRDQTRHQIAGKPPREAAWAEVLQAMFASAEFRYR